MSGSGGAGGNGGRGSGGGSGREEEAPTLTLSDALQLAGLAATGGHAKRRIQAGEVHVNGSVETRRKRRLRAGDEITIGDETVVVELEEEAGDADADAEGHEPPSR